MKKSRKKVGKIILKILSAILCILVVAAGIFSIQGYTMYKKAVENEPFEQMVARIKSDENFVSYSELPQIYIDAVISAEDNRFESHNGVDPLAILRAVWIDITTLSFAEGGSTITQQLMKNQYFTQQKQLQRKFAEAFTAVAFEKEYDKNTIFELYINTIYFGSGYYGLYDAAMGYFGKTPSELSDYEAVLLAGLPNAPSIYSLDNNPDLAAQRMAVVLARMVKYGAITQEKADELLRIAP